MRLLAFSIYGQLVQYTEEPAISKRHKTHTKHTQNWTPCWRHCAIHAVGWQRSPGLYHRKLYYVLYLQTHSCCLSNTCACNWLAQLWKHDNYIPLYPYNLLCSQYLYFLHMYHACACTSSYFLHMYHACTSTSSYFLHMYHACTCTTYTTTFAIIYALWNL